MIDQLGGWALKSVGQGYGDGYDLELLVKYLRNICSEDVQIFILILIYLAVYSFMVKCCLKSLEKKQWKTLRYY